MKYGIVSDIHEDPRLIIPALARFKELGVGRLVLNGDVQEFMGEAKRTQDFLAFVLAAAVKSGLDTFVMPGGHEVYPLFDSVVSHFAGKNDNIFSVSEVSKIKGDDHDVVLVPGSDVVAGPGEYELGDGLQTGLYMKLEEGVIRAEHVKGAGVKSEDFRGFLSYQNINDLAELVDRPERTIVFCHVPRRFDGLVDAVDEAEFGVAAEDFSVDMVLYDDGEVQFGSILKPMKGRTARKFGKGSFFMLALARDLKRAGCPVELRKENKGNSGLKSVYGGLGITKAVSGHFHESVHRAHDSRGNPVAENTFVDELFWNASYLDERKVGVLAVEGGKVSYENIVF